jgi:hypothetical protein
VYAFVLLIVHIMFGAISVAVEHICHGHATCTCTRVLGRHPEHYQCDALR